MLCSCLIQLGWAQKQKSSVYGEVGLGFGQTLFFGNIDEELRAALDGSFDPSIGNNLMMGFYVAPDSGRNGTVDGKGDGVPFTSGQVGVNVVLSF